jgi:hypothetical protein
VYFNFRLDKNPSKRLFVLEQGGDLFRRVCELHTPLGVAVVSYVHHTLSNVEINLKRVRLRLETSLVELSLLPLPLCAGAQTTILYCLTLFLVFFWTNHSRRARPGPTSCFLVQEIATKKG